MRMWKRQRGEVKTGVSMETGAFPFVPSSGGSRDGRGLDVVGSCWRSGQEVFWWCYLGPNCPSCAWGCFYEPACTRAKIGRFWLKGSFPHFPYPSGTREGGEEVGGEWGYKTGVASMQGEPPTWCVSILVMAGTPTLARVWWWPQQTMEMAHDVPSMHSPAPHRHCLQLF